MKKQFTARYKAPITPPERVMIDVPFNVWDEFHCRGPIQVEGSINGVDLAFKLMPKGKGFYAFCLTRAMQKQLCVQDGAPLYIEITPAPFTERPITEISEARRVSSITLVKEPVNTACGQACIAMLANVPIEDVFRKMRTRGPTSASMLLDALYTYRIRHAKAFVRRSKKPFELPEICLIQIRFPDYGHWAIYYKGAFYDPEFGVMNACHPDGKIASFLEIYP